MTTPRTQEGTTSVEFAICGAVLLVLMLGVIEFGRVLFTLHVLSEGARRATRIAAVCAVGDAAIASAALFASLPGTAPTATVSYLDQAGAVVANTVTNYAQIRSVRVTLSGYSMPLAIPFLNPTFNAPAVSWTLPRESLGVPKFGTAPTC